MKVELSLPQIASMTGSISKDSPYYLRYDKKTKRHFLCHKPKKTKKSVKYQTSEPARQRNEQFRQAIQYACSVLKDPNQVAILQPRWEKQIKRYSTFRGWLVNHYYEEFLRHGNSSITGAV